MSVLLAIAAVVTVAGALVAITGRDARVALIGLVVTMSAAPFLADPLPGPAALAARVVAAVLGGYLLFVVLRETTAATRGSLVGSAGRDPRGSGGVRRRLWHERTRQRPPRSGRRQRHGLRPRGHRGGADRPRG